MALIAASLTASAARGTQIVAREQAPADELFSRPLHHYSAGLLAAVPVPDRGVRQDDEAVLGGDVPSSTAALSGCDFHPRCPAATERCREHVPELSEPHAGHRLACHLPLGDS